MVPRCLAPLALGVVLACSSSGGPGEAVPPVETVDGGDAGAVITCDNGADVYVANLSKPGRAAAFTFVLVASDPAPPARGTNMWTLRVLDAAGKAVTGAQVAVTPFMPAHGHGSPAAPTVAARGEDYVVGGISLFMPGLWEVTVDATAGSVRDTAVFAFCVAG